MFIQRILSSFFDDWHLDKLRIGASSLDVFYLIGTLPQSSNENELEDGSQFEDWGKFFCLNLRMNCTYVCLFLVS